MPVDIEETLVRELHEVAEGLDIPAMPRLPEESARPTRRRQPLLAAAAVVAIVAGAAGAVSTLPDGRDTEPARPGPSPSLTPSPSSSPTESVARVPRSAPTLPHVVDGRLYVDDTEVAGTWWSVRAAGETWIALRDDYTWWWGRGPQPNELPIGEDVTPQISPDGRYVAVVRVEDEEGMLSVVDTTTGRVVGGTPQSLGPVQWDYPPYVVAVTGHGRVVVRRGDGHLLWSPGSLAELVPGQMVLDATSAGLVVTDGDGGPPYLAEISDRGELTRVGDLPEHDDLVVSPGGKWLAWTPAGTTGGEVTSIPTLEVSALEGEQSATLTAPDGWHFKMRTWGWEDDSHLVSTVTDDHGRERMARCRALPAECLLIRPD